MELVAANKLDQITYEGVALDAPYDALFGQLPKGVPCHVMLYGRPGSGKSTLLHGFIKSARRKGLTTKQLFVAAEQGGADDDLQDIARRFELHTDAALVYGAWDGWDALKKAITKHRFDMVVLDSVSKIDRYGSHIGGFLEWATRKGVSVISILHVNKDGDYKGTTSLEHDCHIVLEVYKNGEAHLARVDKNRKSRGMPLGQDVPNPMSWAAAEAIARELGRPHQAPASPKRTTAKRTTAKRTTRKRSAAKKPTIDLDALRADIEKL